MVRATLSPVGRMLRRCAGRLRHVRRDTRGSTIIEFAFITPAFIALILAIFQTAILFFAEETLETAAEAAARQITTGQVQNSNAGLGMTQAQFHDQVACPQLAKFMTCTNLIVDVQTYASFDQVSTATPTMTNPDGTPRTTWNYAIGGAGSIVIVRLMYKWSVLPGPLNFSLSNLSNSQRLLVATTVAKTEPYS